jgi:hypothetical protein
LFIGIFISFLIMGFAISVIDMYLPIYLYPVVVMGFRFIGGMLMMIGGIMLLGRMKVTGASLLVDLPKPGQPILVHQRRGKQARLMLGKQVDLEHIYSKGKLFKDSGGAIRLAGHDVRFTHETVAPTIPPIIAQYVYQVKEKYGTDNLDKLRELHDKLKTLTNYDELNRIEELRPILLDDEKRALILGMEIRDIRNMSELLYDGQILHYDNFEDFNESAAPYDIDSFVTHHIAHRTWQFKAYQGMGAIEWSKIIMPLAILLILGAIAFQIFGG